MSVKLILKKKCASVRVCTLALYSALLFILLFNLYWIGCQMEMAHQRGDTECKNAILVSLCVKYIYLCIIIYGRKATKTNSSLISFCLHSLDLYRTTQRTQLPPHFHMWQANNVCLLTLFYLSLSLYCLARPLCSSISQRWNHDTLEFRKLAFMKIIFIVRVATYTHTHTLYAVPCFRLICCSFALVLFDSIFDTLTKNLYGYRYMYTCCEWITTKEFRVPYFYFWCVASVGWLNLFPLHLVPDLLDERVLFYLYNIYLQHSFTPQTPTLWCIVAHFMSCHSFVSNFIKIIEFDIRPPEQVRNVISKYKNTREKWYEYTKSKNKQEHEQLSDEFECLSRRRTDMNMWAYQNFKKRK